MIASVARAGSYTQTEAPLVITDATGNKSSSTPGPVVSSSNVVSGELSSITAMTVSLAISHSWFGDLIVTLQAPGGGPTIDLFRKVGQRDAPAANGNNSDNHNFVVTNTYSFSDSAGTTRLYNGATYTGNTVNSATFRATNNIYNGVNDGSGEVIQPFLGVGG